MEGYTTTTTEKTAPCAGCGGKFPVRELAEITGEELEFVATPLAHFPGEILCPGCYTEAA